MELQQEAEELFARLRAGVREVQAELARLRANENADRANRHHLRERRKFVVMLPDVLRLREAANRGGHSEMEARR